jgi:PPOX class probable F420-dependent enzyme
MTMLSSDVQQLLDSSALAWATTVRADGSIHSTIVLADRDGDDIVFTTMEGFAKLRQLRRSPEMAVSVVDPDNGWRFASISGTATIETAGAADLLARLSRKFFGSDVAAMENERARLEQGGSARVVVRLTPHKVIEQNRPRPAL